MNTDPTQVTVQDIPNGFQDRFWSKVNKTEQCWIWTAAADSLGYGRITLRHKFGTILAHRASWVIAFGYIPQGMCVLHKCDNPRCVNPQHLFLGTRADNLADMDKKGRRVSGSMPGEKHPNHKLTLKEVEEIKRLRSEGTFLKLLGERYGVHLSTIGKITTGVNWAWIH